MRLVDRYLIRGFILCFLYCLLLFSILSIIVDSFNNLNEFLRHGVTLKIVLSYYFYLFPSIFVQIVPMAALVGILYILGSLNRHNEIIALKTSGVSALHILSPFLFVGILISIAVFSINETYVPQSLVTSRSIMQGLIMKGKKNLNERSIKNVTHYGAEHRMFFAREYEVENQTLHDVVIFEDSAGDKLKSKLVAKKAKFEDGRW